MKPSREARCPLRVPIPQMFKTMSEGKYREAAILLSECSFLAGILGRVCPQELLCQKACTRGQERARPIPIDIVKLEYLIELTCLKIDGQLPLPEKAPFTGKYAALIGSGPANLQLAYDLAKAGHKVVVFEHLFKPGGVLVYGIPTFRLPPELLSEKIRILKDLGVVFIFDTLVGENGAFNVEELMQSFDVVAFGVGAGKSKVMSDRQGLTIPGRIHNGIYSAYHFLSFSFLMQSLRPGFATPPPLSARLRKAFLESRRAIESGKKGLGDVNIVVLGVGNVAMDCGRTARRMIEILDHRYGTRVIPKIRFILRRTRRETEDKRREEEEKHAMEELGGDWVNAVGLTDLPEEVEFPANLQDTISFDSERKEIIFK